MAAGEAGTATAACRTSAVCAAAGIIASKTASALAQAWWCRMRITEPSAPAILCAHRFPVSESDHAVTFWQGMVVPQHFGGARSFGKRDAPFLTMR
jgi:hypothetical protein